jgi:hypothetical protein
MLELLLVIIGWIAPATYEPVETDLSPAGIDQFASAATRP